jgi:methylene-fatty-acyl-phospholipid synthase
MSWPMLAIATVLLSIERLANVFAWRRPERFQQWCGRIGTPDPVAALAGLFVLFKIIQAGVFAAWIIVHGGPSSPADVPLFQLAAGLACVAMGQALNVGVFIRLGHAGVFYGSQFGRPVRWSHEFPFSVMAHPQYVGAVMTIWGVFLIFRFPNPDWFVLPALETAYYAIGARLER